MTKTAGAMTLLRSIGIHPAAALVAVAVDLMLFVGVVGTAGVGWVLSIPVGFVVAIIVTLFQRWGTQDNMGLAVAKGLSVGLLTAIPTPLPSVVTLGLGTAGGIQRRRDRRAL